MIDDIESALTVFVPIRQYITFYSNLFGNDLCNVVNHSWCYFSSYRKNGFDDDEDECMRHHLGNLAFKDCSKSSSGFSKSNVKAGSVTSLINTSKIISIHLSVGFLTVDFYMLIVNHIMRWQLIIFRFIVRYFKKSVLLVFFVIMRIAIVN